MYLVKLKQKNSKKHSYSNWNIIATSTEINENGHNKEWFLLDKEEANKLALQLISRNGSYDDFNLEYISVVKASTYAPYPEVEVVFYREFA